MNYKEVEIQEKGPENRDLGQIGSSFTKNSSAKVPKTSLTKSYHQKYILLHIAPNVDGSGRF